MNLAVPSLCAQLPFLDEWMGARVLGVFLVGFFFGFVF